MEIGREIMEAQDNNPRAEYDAGLIKNLAERLTGEFGKGFSFVARQKRITIEGDRYYIDLVFL